MKKLLLYLLIAAMLMLALPALSTLSPKNEAVSSSPVESSAPPASEPAAEETTPETTQPEALLPASYTILDEEGQEVQVTPVEYLKGVAAAELPGSWDQQTRIAQMVAAHSYALAVMGASPEEVTLTADPGRHQGYYNLEQRQELYGDQFAQMEAQLEEAATEAVGWLLTIDGNQILPAAYHSCSAGYTEDAETVWGRAVPCLSGVDSEVDRENPDFFQEHTFSADELSSLLESHLPDGDFSGPSSQWLQILETSPAGTITQMTAGGATCTGLELRSWLGLSSAVFSIQCGDNGDITFTTSGSGHGVGMSQYGARQMALDGSSWQEILAHYYPGSLLIQAKLS